jgi:DDE superfamily endonuclease
VGFVGAMEDVLSVYELPYDQDYPQVCLDEKLVTLHADVVEPLPLQPGQPERVDYEYERAGTANLFVMVERLTGYRHVEVTERRTAVDYAWRLQWLADVCYPQAKKIRLVQDNLNTHRLANLYLVFPPAEARRLAQRFELHFTPTHGSWLNMAEIEIGLFERGCLGRRVPNLTVLQRRVAALEAERNAANATIDWRFTTGDARVRLARLYPKLDQPDAQTIPKT